LLLDSNQNQIVSGNQAATSGVSHARACMCLCACVP
jgi:hypothetical protein